MTAQPPSYDPQNFRSDAVPSDTQAIYIQEGGDSASNLFNLPSKHPKILRLQEIMIVSAIICFIHGLISAFAPGNAKPLEGLPEFGVWRHWVACCFGCCLSHRLFHGAKR